MSGPAGAAGAADVGVRRAIDLLGDADPDVRLASVMTLGEGRHDVAAARLVERFGREWDFQVREAITWAMLRLDDTVLELVRDALDDARWTSRLQAVHTLSKLGRPEDTACLLPLVDDPVDCVAARAYGAVAQSGDPVAVEPLVDQLSRGGSEHRNSLLVALSHFGAAAVPALVAALQVGTSGPVRQHAADCLAYLGGPLPAAAETALRSAVEDTDELVRLAALNALGQLRTRTAWEAIGERTDATGRLGVLARRLQQRRPAGHELDAGPPADPPRDSGGARDDRGSIGRRWPTPDLDVVDVRGGPLKERLVPMLALQVEVCQPRYLSRAEVPEDELAAVADRAYDRATGGDRPDGLARRIAAGAVEQHLHDTVLLEQICVADPGRVVGELLYGTGVTVADFRRRVRAD